MLKGGNMAVIEMLRANGLLLAAEEFKHRYPYDWRAKQPVILRYNTPPPQFLFIEEMSVVAFSRRLQSHKAVVHEPALGARVCPEGTAGGDHGAPLGQGAPRGHAPAARGLVHQPAGAFIREPS